MTAPSYRDSHLTKGADYDQSFQSLPHRAVLWQLEQDLLTQIAMEFFPSKIPAYLDFACGTGRILAHFQNLTMSSIGVDVSSSMLDVARKNASTATFVLEDITKRDPFEGRKFNLITAFRFFPNAEPPLRAAVMRALAQFLAPDGVLVFNNHKNSESLLSRMVQLWKKRPTQEHFQDAATIDRLMSHGEVLDLINQQELKVIQRHAVGVLPCTDQHMFLSSRFLKFFEKKISKIQGMSTIAQNVVYVCQRK